MVVDEYLSREECRDIISSIEEHISPHPSGEIGMFAGPSFNEDSIPNDSLGKIAHSVKKSVSARFGGEYKIKNLFYSKMSKGAYNKMHYDNYYVSADDNSVKPRGPHQFDKSAILYLSDDYDGGELHFPLQSLTLKPTPGTLVMFEGNTKVPHEVKTVKSGSRYNIIMFLATELSPEPELEQEADLTNDIIYRGVNNANI